MQQIMNALRPIMMNAIAEALARPEVQAALQPMIANEVAAMLIADAAPAIPPA